MKINTSNVKWRNVTKSAALAGLLAAGFSMSYPAKAVYSVVTNPTAMIQSAWQFSKEVVEWGKTFQHYQQVVGHQMQQLQHWRAQLNKLKRLEFSLFEVKRTFTKLEEDFNVDVECPGRIRSGGIAGLRDVALDKLVPDMKGNVLQQQQNLCAQIVQAKNIKYNETVEYLEFVAKKAEEIALIQDELVADLGGDPGDTEGLIQQLIEYGQTLDTARANWQSSQQQTDEDIKMLLSMQATLSRRAMHGKPSDVGALVNTLALKAALSN